MGSTKPSAEEHPGIERIDICSWDQFLAHILSTAEISAPDSISSAKYPYIYRGARNAGWRPQTSLEREYEESAFKRGHKCIDTYEQVLLRNFSKYARIHYNWAQVNYIDQMVIAQHHGLPTRLLDWSHSPLVGLYFATRADNPVEERTDGVIWQLDHDAAMRKLDSDHRQVLEDHQAARSFTPAMLIKVHRSLRSLSCPQNNHKRQLLVLDPPMLDHRIVNQASVFTLVTGNTCDGGVHEDWFRQHHDAVRCYKIRASAKAGIREILQLLNITDRVLFPGLAGVADTLKDRYRRREASSQAKE